MFSEEQKNELMILFKEELGVELPEEETLNYMSSFLFLLEDVYKNKEVFYERKS